MAGTNFLSVSLALTVSAGAVAAAPATTTTAATTTTSATSKPAPATRRAETSARHPAIQSAIAALTREIESALRTNTDPPRAESNYFDDHPAEDLPPQAVIAALRRPISNDPRGAAYVKWQLLSGLPEQLDPKTAADLLQAYRAAPQPFDRPGIDKQQREALDRLTRNAREADEQAVSEQFELTVARTQADNALILKYRDALFARLPPSYDAIAAGFEDAVARMHAGVDSDDHVRAVCEVIGPWASSAPPEQLQALSRAVAQLRKQKGAEYYDRVAWNVRSRKLEWKKDQASLPPKPLEEVEELLQDRIQNPNTPLKLKKER